MFICPNCKKTSETPLNFCTYCGSRMEEVNTAQSAPVNEATRGGYGNNMPDAPKPSKAKSIVGMVLSIIGFGNSAFGILYTLIYMATQSGEFTFTFALIMFLIAFPTSLVGLILSSKSRKAGDLSVFTKLGRLFGIFGIISSGIMLLIGISSLNYNYTPYEDFSDDFDYYY